MGQLTKIRIGTIQGTLEVEFRIPNRVTKEEADREHDNIDREIREAEEFEAFARAHNFYTHFPTMLDLRRDWTDRDRAFLREWEEKIPHLSTHAIICEICSKIQMASIEDSMEDPEYVVRRANDQAMGELLATLEPTELTVLFREMVHRGFPEKFAAWIREDLRTRCVPTFTSVRLVS